MLETLYFMNYGNEALLTIDKQLQVPETRMKNARQVQDYCRRLIDNDQRRSYKRSRVNGLVDGNPPYKISKLKSAGRADACNVNWGIARAYLEAAQGAFYDLFSEAPTFIRVLTDCSDDPEKNSVWSRIIGEESDRVLREDRTWDYNMQVSINEMVQHGCGPMLFEDNHKVLPKAFLSGDLKVPEFTKSDTSYWEIGLIQATYYPPELFAFIESEKAAAARGWDTKYTKRVIANAMDIRVQPGLRYEWEWYQQELKNNALSYYDDTKVCRVCHVFWKEFDGRITHAIVERDTTVTSVGEGRATSDESKDVQYLFMEVGRYENFQEAIHPMYYDHGNGGWHHSVTGMGVKMFAAMEYQNRLLCNLADKAFAPKILFKPTTTETSQKFSLAHFGDYAVLPGGFDWQQTGVAGLMNDGLAMNTELTNLMQSNLSSYKQQETKRQGNPVTARQVMYEAQQQASLSKTQFNRYYEQLDMLYSEIMRRLCNRISTDERAKDFQKRCLDRQVPKEAFDHIYKVEATRVTGQGSAFVRKQSLSQLWMTLAPSLPEDGRDNLIADMIGAEAGQSAVERYYPKGEAEKLATDQQAEALQWCGLMKIGVQPVVTSSQNPVMYAASFINAASQALESLAKGANPEEVLNFLHVIGPAIAAHLKRFANDQSRAPIFKEMTSQWQRIANMADQLQAKIQAQQEQQQALQQKTQAVMTDEQIKAAKLKSDIELKTVKTQAGLQQSKERHMQKMQQSQQDMAIKDATSAVDIHLKKRQQDSDIAMAEIASEDSSE
jgi:hypothetical protein